MALDVVSSIRLNMQDAYSTSDIVHVNQYDSGLRVKAVLLDGKEKWEVPSGAKAVVAFKKSDNIGGFYDATDDDPSVQAVSVDSDRSIIYISLDAQTTTTPTTANQYVDMQVVFYQNGKRLSTFAFYMDVRPSTVASKDITSSWVFHILAKEIASTLTVATTPDAMREWLETNIHPYQGYPIDDTLTVPGAASDAAATGKMVTVSDQNPNTVANKVWVKKTPYEIQVPTYEEFNSLSSAAVSRSKTNNKFWHIGYWASTTGLGYSSNAKYIRTNQSIDNTIVDIECSDDYLMYLMAYDEHTYVGEWNGLTFSIPASASVAKNDARMYYDIQSIRNQYPTYIFRITVIRVDNKNIDINDACENIVIRRSLALVEENKMEITNGHLELPKLWDNGSITTLGENDWNDKCYRRLSSISYFRFLMPVMLVPKAGIQFSVSVYNNNETFESISQDWLDSTYIFDNPNKLYRINLKPENDTDELYPSQIDNYIEAYVCDALSIDDIEIFNKNNVSDIGRLLIPCDNNELSSQYLVSKKNGSIIDFTLYTVGTWRFSIYDQYAATTINPTYDSRPTWYHKECDKFILGHTYYFDYKQIDGSLNEINRVYYDLRTISGDIIQIDIKSTWECNFIPEMIAFCLKNSASDTATIELVIYDVTEIKTFPVISDISLLNERTEKIEDFINNKIELFENTKTWKTGIVTADAKVKAGNGAIPNARKLDEYSKVILADGCSVICFYFSDEYLGKIAADNSINKNYSDWGYFRGEFDPHDYAPADAKYFLTVVCPEDGTTLTDNNVVDWANAHCTFVTYKSVINDNNLQSQINELSNVTVITDYTPKYVNYGYDETIVSMGQPTLTTGDVLSVSRNGTRVIIDGTSGNSNTYIKLSGDFTKVTAVASLTNGIALENGHTYRVSWKLISGTVTIPEGRVYPYISVFPVESNAAIGRPTYGLNGYRDFTYTDTEVNLCMFVQKGSLVFSNAEYSITLEDLSARYNIAPYYISELLDTVKKARNLNDEPSLVFPLVTDIHRYAVDYQNFNRTIENMIAFNKYIKCDFIINLGDSMNGNIPVADSLQLAYNTTEAFLNTGIPYYFVNGNHDTNYRYSEAFDIKQNYKAFFTANKNIVINPDTYGTDYYVNFDGIRVRLICLNACNSMVQLPYAYGSSTAAWLAEALDPSYKIILCEHLSSIASQDYGNRAPANSEAITSVIQTFVNNGGSLVQFTGHTHADIAFISPWISIVQAASRLATVPVSASGIQKITGYIDAISAETRTPFTVSEDLWSVCIYKPISNVVHTIRFGSGKDRHFHVTPIEPQTVSTILDGVITWSTSDASVATVNNGTISYVGSGTCAILAKDADGNYECWTVKNN